MLGRLLTLAIVLAVVLFILTEARPWIRRQFGGGSTRQYGQPPVDVDSWSSAQWEIDSEIQSAESACYCPAPACQSATEALAAMRELVDNLDGMVRGTSPGFANPANQQARIFDLLDAARSSAGY